MCSNSLLLRTVGRPSHRSVMGQRACLRSNSTHGRVVGPTGNSSPPLKVSLRALVSIIAQDSMSNVNLGVLSRVPLSAILVSLSRTFLFALQRAIAWRNHLILPQANLLQQIK